MMVINFCERHHPVGGLALHRQQGIVDVVDSDGAMMRQVVWLDWDENGEIVMLDAWVHVSTLSEANLLKDAQAILAQSRR